MARYFEEIYPPVLSEGFNTNKPATFGSSVGFRSATAPAAAAAATPAGITLYSTGIGIYAGSGTPNAVVSATKGSLYINTAGSTTNDRLYVNTNGTTAWTAVTTAG